MNAPTRTLTLDTPAFLECKEPLAQYALWNDGRLQIVKDEDTISLSRDDLHALRRYFDQFLTEVRDGHLAPLD